MRGFIVTVALLGLAACGGAMSPEQMEATQAPATDSAAPAEVNAESLICTDGSWECYCGQFKTSTACSGATRCFWYNNRCQPTYE
jgi:hypothetical protein